VSVLMSCALLSPLIVSIVMLWWCETSTRLTVSWWWLSLWSCYYWYHFCWLCATYMSVFCGLSPVIRTLNRNHLTLTSSAWILSFFLRTDWSMSCKFTVCFALCNPCRSILKPICSPLIVNGKFIWRFVHICR